MSLVRCLSCSIILGFLTSAAPLAGDEKPARLTIATWNLEWFYDQYTGDNYADLAKQQSAPSREDWDWKNGEVAKVISQMRPDILALQEVENQRVLFYLTQKLKKEYGLEYRVAFIEGGDFFTEQDVAILALTGLTGFARKERTKEQAESKDFYNLQKHLIAEFEWGTGSESERLTIVNLHTRAMTNAAPIRQRQARLVREWMKDRITPKENLIILGDLNSDELIQQTTKEGDMGVFRGLDTMTPDDDLFDAHLKLTGDAKASHLNGMQYDRVLCSEALMKDDPARTDLIFKSAIIRRDLVLRGKEQDKDHMDIFWTIPQEERDVSDHYPLVTEFEFK